MERKEQNGVKGADCAYRTDCRYASASVSSSSSRSSSLNAALSLRPGKQHRWPYVTSVAGS